MVDHAIRVFVFFFVGGGGVVIAGHVDLTNRAVTFR